MISNSEPSMNQAFLQKLTDTVLANLENEQFGVEELSEQVGISRSQLHRKLKLLKGKSVSQFIREVRLEEAIKLLQKEVGTASEIAYRVGFSSPTYFHRCFRSRYGYSPGDVKKMIPGDQKEDLNYTGQASYDIEESEKQLPEFSKNPSSNKRSLKIKIFDKRILALGIIVIMVLFIGYRYYYANHQVARSIAVLPLHNYTGEKEQEYFAKGFHDALIGALGQISSLRVISRTSTLRYDEDHLASLQNIARELGVDAVVEGSVTGSGDHVVIQLQLIDAFPKERHLWAKEYQQDFRNILVLQSDIVRNIAKEIQVSLTPKEKSLLADVHEVNPEAYQAYLRGRFHWDKLTKEDLDKALQYFELAREIDPDYALAYAGIALVWVGRLQQGLTSYIQAGPKIKVAALKALELDNSLSEVHFVLGGISCWVDWDYAKAEKELRQAIALNPNNSAARAYLSHVLNILHQPKEAMEQIDQAIQLDPFNSLYQSLYGMDMLYTRQFDKAITSLSAALKNSPTDPVALSTLRTSYHMKGMYKEALEIWKMSYAAKEDQFAVEALIRGEQQGGYSTALEKLAETLIARSDTSYITPWQIGTLYTRAGNKKKAIDWLEKAFQAHDNNMPYIGVDPIFDVLRDDERFRTLLQKMNLPLNEHPIASLRNQNAQ